VRRSRTGLPQRRKRGDRKKLTPACSTGSDLPDDSRRKKKKEGEGKARRGGSFFTSGGKKGGMKNKAPYLLYILIPGRAQKGRREKKKKEGKDTVGRRRVFEKREERMAS